MRKQEEKPVGTAGNRRLTPRGCDQAERRTVRKWRCGSGGQGCWEAAGDISISIIGSNEPKGCSVEEFLEGREEEDVRTRDEVSCRHILLTIRCFISVFSIFNKQQYNGIIVNLL